MFETLAIQRLFAASVLVVSSFLAGLSTAQQTPLVPATALPRAVSEAEGVSSEAIAAFLDAFVGTNHELHSMMLLRHGKVVAEGWWKPYAPELTHSMYSTTKSFTATAIGLAVGEDRLRVEDKVISFFPELVPTPMPPHLSELTVQHLLSMTVGHDPDPSQVIPGMSDTWVNSFLATPIVKEPGSTFLYNSMASHMLSAIVTKVTGEKLIDYLQPRLFEPLGISGIDWETDPEGNNTGGWGLRLHTEDMAKFGQLFLQDGVWNGDRLLPEGWVAEASSFKIQQDPDRPAEQRAKSDWHQGYCYQMWRCLHNAFRGDGAFGQYIVMMPDQDAVLVITSQTGNMQGMLDLVWEHLLPSMHNGALPANSAGVAALRSRLDGLALAVPLGSPSPEKENELSGKRFALATNERNMTRIGFAFDTGACTVNIEDDRGAYTIPMRAGAWAFSETSRRGPYLVARAKNSLMGLPPFKVACAYRWLDDGALELTLRYIESPHTEALECQFEGDRIDIDVTTGVRAPVKISGELTR
jgi:CubicO group peptidase (beta-lactamase class C family)